MMRGTCECGRTVIGSASVHTVQCAACDRLITLQPVQIDNTATTQRSRNIRHARTLVDQCKTNACGHYGRHKYAGKITEGCGLLPSVASRSPCQIFEHLYEGGGCVRNPPVFQIDPVQCRDYQHEQLAGVPTFKRDKLPGDCMVITGANQRFIRGAYFMTWTLLRSNNVQCRVYTRDVPADDPHVQQMHAWGVQIHDMPRDVPSGTFFEDTWNKPACIADAMGSAERVLWLDSDTSVAKSVRPAFDWIGDQPFAANHGIYKSDAKNDQVVWDLLGHPKRHWGPHEAPCAGVVGFHADRDADLVAEWRRRIAIVIPRRDLWGQQLNHNGNPSPLMYHDQGVLQDLLDTDTADGSVWSNFQVRRTGTIAQLMAQTYDFDHHVVCHYGGETKPWFSWPAVLNWGDPRAR